jgi:hypothetical protein
MPPTRRLAAAIARTVGANESCWVPFPYGRVATSGRG